WKTPAAERADASYRSQPRAALRAISCGQPRAAGRCGCDWSPGAARRASPGAPRQGSPSILRTDCVPSFARAEKRLKSCSALWVVELAPFDEGCAGDLIGARPALAARDHLVPNGWGDVNALKQRFQERQAVDE